VQEAINTMCRKDWPGTVYTDMDIFPESMIVTESNGTDNSTTPEPFRQPETDIRTKQGYISLDQWRKHPDRRTPAEKEAIMQTVQDCMDDMTLAYILRQAE